MLASEQGQNMEKLARAVISADGSDENKIASAARADTTGREKAIAILTVLLGQVDPTCDVRRPRASAR